MTYVLAKGAKPFREFMELCAPQPDNFMNWQLRSGSDLLMEYHTPFPESWLPSSVIMGKMVGTCHMVTHV